MRSFFIVFLSICSIITGVFAFIDYFEEDEIEISNIEHPVYITVWVASDELQRGKNISYKNLVKKQLPIEESLVYGVKEDVVLDFSADTLLNTDINKGELVWPENQSKVGDSGYIELLIDENMTLFPLEVSSKSLINDYIHPGSYIDIFSVSSPNENLSIKNKKVKYFQGVNTKLFLRNIKVLNIGNNKSGMIKASTPTKENEYTTIVIEVRPEDLSILTLAQRTMHLEIHLSQEYKKSMYTEVSDILENYINIDEIRGSNGNSRGAM